MTSLVTLVSLTYGGEDLGDIDGITLDLWKGGPGEHAEHRGTDWTAPGRVGQTAGNRLPHKRTIELRGTVFGAGATKAEQDADYWANRIILAGWFDPTVTADLVASTPGGFYTIAARTRGVDGIVYNQIAPAYADVSIVLESVVPDWEAGGS